MERRKHERTLFKADATVVCEGRTITGAVEDISVRGLYLKTSQHLPLGTTVNINIFLTGTSGNLSFTIPAKVVREGNDGIGFSYDRIDTKSVLIEFLNIPGTDINELLEVINK